MICTYERWGGGGSGGSGGCGAVEGEDRREWGREMAEKNKRGGAGRGEAA